MIDFHRLTLHFYTQENVTVLHLENSQPSLLLALFLTLCFLLLFSGFSSI